MVYLDNHSTTRPLPEVVEAMQVGLQDQWSNPNSNHRAAQIVRGKVEESRGQVAKLINCSPKEIIFTSGGTEGANWPIYAALASAVQPLDIVTTSIEHAAVLEAAMILSSRIKGTHHQLKVNADGVVDPAELEQILDKAENPVALVSVMWVNNLTGVVQPVEEIGEICKRRGVPFHVDGSQWVGKMSVDVSNLPADYLTISAHKFHGPKGVGGLWIRPSSPVTQVMMGGVQERGRRGGTENVPGILGFGVASEMVKAWFDSPNHLDDLLQYRERFEQKILEAIPEVYVLGGSAPRIWSCSCLAFPQVDADLFLLYLSESGLASTAGAACASGSIIEPPVVGLMRKAGAEISNAAATVRFSFNRFQTLNEIDTAVDSIISAARRAAVLIESA